MNPQVGTTKYYRNAQGQYTVGEATGNDQGILNAGYTDLGSKQAYIDSLKQDIAKYQGLQSQIEKSSPTDLTYTYKGTGQNYSGYDPFQYAQQLQQKLAEAQAGQGIYADNYNSGAQNVGGVYTSKQALDQQQANQSLVASGQMKPVDLGNGVTGYLPNNAAPFVQGTQGQPTGQQVVSGPTPSMAMTNTSGGIQSPYMSSIAPVGGQSTTSSATFNPTSNLAPGSTGEDVKNLQNWLISQGYSIPAGATGNYGPQTQAAVAKWQADNNIDTKGNSGYFGPISRAFLASNPPVGNTSGLNTSGINPYGKVDPNAPVNLGTSGQSSFGQDMLGGLSTQDVLNQRNGMENTINSYLQQQAQAYADKTKLDALQALELQNINYGNSLTPDGQVRAGGSTLDAQQAEMKALDAKLNPLKTIADMNYNTAVNALALYKQTPQYQTEQQARDTFFNLAQTYSDVPGGITYDPSKTANENLAIAQQKMQASPKYQASLVNLGGYTDANGVFHTYVRKSPDLSASILGGASGQLPTASTPHTSVGSYTGGSSGTVSPSQATATSSRDVVWPGTPTKTSVAAQNDFQTGATGKALTSLKTAIGHVFDADIKYGKIDPTNYQGLNAVKNFGDTMTGGSAPGAYAQAATLAASELAKVYGADTGGERTSFSAFGAAYQTQAQHDEFVKTTSSLLSSKVGAILDQLKQSGAVVKSLDGVMTPLDQVKLAKLGFNLNGIAPGIGVSPTTQAMINSYQYYPKDVTLSSGKVISAGLYAPNANGGFSKVN